MLMFVSLLFHVISIHAPREGSDPKRPTKSRKRSNFYPRSPRGERPSYFITLTYTEEFLSTLPARGATALAMRLAQYGQDFYPRSPRGERPPSSLSSLYQRGISIHAPREGSDPVTVLPFFVHDISIHAPREGSDAFFSETKSGI